MRLWDAAGLELDDAILAFTIGDDPVLDRELLPFDCLGSAAQAAMLASQGFLSTDEKDALFGALSEALGLAEAGTFEILPEQEDGHTALEAFLTEKVGDAGKRIHTGRSRNDQVITALRLLVRERLLTIVHDALEMAENLSQRGDEHAQTLMPGYTHTRQAMPSTVGHLFYAAAEGLVRDVEGAEAALRRAHRSALGAASGYGAPLPLDRSHVAQLLGLQAVDENSIYVQNTRGMLEAVTLSVLHMLSLTLARLATDLVWFSSEAFGFFALPTDLTTGSSIMPQKRNPDVLELVRAAPATFLGAYTEVSGLLHGLPAGYHRDLQRTKAPMLRALNEARSLVAVMAHAVAKLQVDPEACAAALRPEIYATDQAFAYVRQGASFRDAYRQVKREGPIHLEPKTVLAHRTHIGAPGTRQGDALRASIREVRARLEIYVEGAAAARRLLPLPVEAASETVSTPTSEPPASEPPASQPPASQPPASQPAEDAPSKDATPESDAG